MPKIRTLSAPEVEHHRAGVLVDEAHPGLRLVAHLSGRRSWIYRYRRQDATRGQVKLGSYPRMSLGEARKAWDAAKRIRDDPTQGDPRSARKAAVAAQELARMRAYTVRQLLEDYYRLHASKLKRGDEQRRMLTHDVLPAWGARAAESITPREVVDLAEAIADRAERIAQMVVSALRKAFELAKSRHRIDGPNPCAGVNVGKYVPRDRALSDVELRELLAWLPGAAWSENVRDALLMTLYTAARSGEVVAMEWSEVDLAAAVWTQPKRKTKNGRAHRVMLAHQVVQLLETRRALHPRWVFPSRDDQALRQKALGVAQFETREACPVADWVVHDLRRSSATGLARLGCPRVVLDRVQNHVDRSVAAIYDVHSYDNEARDWLQRWADHLDRLREPKVIEFPAARAA